MILAHQILEAAEKQLSQYCSSTRMSEFYSRRMGTQPLCTFRATHTLLSLPYFENCGRKVVERVQRGISRALSESSLPRLPSLALLCQLPGHLPTIA